MKVGIDLVQISRIAESVAAFGDRFVARVFTDGERAYAYAGGPERAAEKLAARFAAKEAAKKALGLDGVGWRAIEVVRGADGAPALALHGVTIVGQLAVSFSHEGDYATAVVIWYGGDTPS